MTDNVIEYLWLMVYDFMHRKVFVEEVTIYRRWLGPCCDSWHSVTLTFANVKEKPCLNVIAAPQSIFKLSTGAGRTEFPKLPRIWKPLRPECIGMESEENRQIVS